MTAPSPGWYPDPMDPTLQRYYDGTAWTEHTAPVVHTPPQPLAVVEGPNHMLHAILTFFTWPFCGGWAWVWLFIALNNKKQVRYVK